MAQDKTRYMATVKLDNDGDFVLENNDLRICYEGESVNQSCWVRLKQRKEYYSFDLELGNYAFYALSMGLTPAVKELIETYLEESLEPELRMGRVLDILSIDVLEPDTSLDVLSRDHEVGFEIRLIDMFNESLFLTGGINL